MAPTLTTLPPEMVSRIVENLPLQDLKNFRLVSKKTGEDSFWHFGSRVNHAKVMLDRDNNSKLSMLLEHNQVQVSKLTIDVSSGFGPDLLPADFARLVVQTVVTKLRGPFDLVLRYCDPTEARKSFRVKHHDSFLLSFAIDLFDGRPSLPRLGTLTLDGMSCTTYGLIPLFMTSNLTLRHLSFQLVTMTKADLCTVLSRIYDHMPHLSTFDLFSVQVKVAVDRSEGPELYDAVSTTMNFDYLQLMVESNWFNMVNEESSGDGGQLQISWYSNEARATSEKAVQFGIPWLMRLLDG